LRRSVFKIYRFGDRNFEWDQVYLFLFRTSSHHASDRLPTSKSNVSSRSITNGFPKDRTTRPGYDQTMPVLLARRCAYGGSLFTICVRISVHREFRIGLDHSAVTLRLLWHDKSILNLSRNADAATSCQNLFVVQFNPFVGCHYRSVASGL